ncbi:hypothetical protein [Bacteroides sp.]|uniref:hypothetical protein n=1 Tax=Bacteroides sp. TaxID=29523 RepID=UPI0025BCE944|nr:hypothetical protein [Bacteroides sp.]
MKNLKELSATHYGDFEGVVSISYQDMFLDKIKALNLPDGVIVGFGFGFIEIKGDKALDYVDIYFYIAQPEYGKTVQEIISSGVNKLKVSKVSRRIKIDNLSEYIKNFDCCGIHKDLKVVEFEVV